MALFCVKPYMTSLNDCGVLCITLHFLQFDALDYSECVSSVFVPLCFSPSVHVECGLDIVGVSSCERAYVECVLDPSFACPFIVVIT